MEAYLNFDRLGEHTRGMLVVDRRGGESHYREGANRAQEYPAVVPAAPGTATDAAIQVENQLDGIRVKNVEGVPVLVGSPKPTKLIQLMLKRIWGVSLGDDAHHVN